MNSVQALNEGKKSYSRFRVLPKLSLALLLSLVPVFSALQRYEASIELVVLIAAFFFIAIYSISIYQFVLVMRFSKLTGAHTSTKTFGYILLLIITFPGVFMMNDAGKRIAYQLGWDIPPYMK